MPTGREMKEFIAKTYKDDETVAFDVYNVADALNYCRRIYREDVTEDMAARALEAMHYNKDCNEGYNWTSLMEHIPKPEGEDYHRDGCAPFPNDDD